MNRQAIKKRERERTPNNRTTTGFRISDELWAVLQPLLPVHENTHRFGGGRPRVPDRACADAIFYVLRTRCQWQALDHTELCAHSTAHDRFQEWVQAGVFLKLWQAGLEQFEELCGIDWQALRWVVERAHSWMNRFRRLLVRWDKKPENYLAFLHFACGLIAFRAAGTLDPTSDPSGKVGRTCDEQAPFCDSSVRFQDYTCFGRPL